MSSSEYYTELLPSSFWDLNAAYIDSFFTDVSGESIGHIFKVQAVQYVHVLIFVYPHVATETL
jgi:hypothetical protein